MSKSPIPFENNKEVELENSKIDWYLTCKAIVKDHAMVTKAEWNNPDIYLFLNGETLCIHQANGTVNSLTVRYADMIAEDYQIVGYIES